MTFDQVLAERFPNSVTATSFASRSHSALYQAGFHRSNTLTCVALCRDELTQPLRRTLDNLWGDGFDASALAGVPSLGRVGLSAAAGHTPVSGGRGRLVVYALTHIAIGRDGELGASSRQGRTDGSSACGALAAVRQAAEDGAFGAELDAAEPEFSLLRTHLSPRMPPDRVPDLAELTNIAHDVIADTLTRDLEAVVDTDGTDYGLVTGVLVHAHAGREFVWPGRMYAVVSGERRDLSLGAV
jgi:hypothetical protein